MPETRASSRSHSAAPSAETERARKLALAAWVPPGTRGQPKSASQPPGRLVFIPPAAMPPLCGKDSDFPTVPFFASYPQQPPAVGGSKESKESALDLEWSAPGQAIDAVLKPPALGGDKEDEKQQQDKAETEESVDFGDDEADRKEAEKRKEEEDQRPPPPTPRNGTYWTHADEKYNDDIRRKHGEKPVFTEAIFQAQKGKSAKEKAECNTCTRELLDGQEMFRRRAQAENVASEDYKWIPETSILDKPPTWYTRAQHRLLDPDTLPHAPGRELWSHTPYELARMEDLPKADSSDLGPPADLGLTGVDKGWKRKSIFVSPMTREVKLLNGIETMDEVDNTTRSRLKRIPLAVQGKGADAIMSLTHTSIRGFKVAETFEDAVKVHTYAPTLLHTLPFGIGVRGYRGPPNGEKDMNSSMERSWTTEIDDSLDSPALGEPRQRQLYDMRRHPKTKANTPEEPGQGGALDASKEADEDLQFYPAIECVVAETGININIKQERPDKRHGRYDAEPKDKAKYMETLCTLAFNRIKACADEGRVDDNLYHFQSHFCNRCAQLPLRANDPPPFIRISKTYQRPDKDGYGGGHFPHLTSWQHVNKAMGPGTGLPPLHVDNDTDWHESLMENIIMTPSGRVERRLWGDTNVAFMVDELEGDISNVVVAQQWSPLNTQLPTWTSGGWCTTEYQETLCLQGEP